MGFLHSEFTDAQKVKYPIKWFAVWGEAYTLCVRLTLFISATYPFSYSIEDKEKTATFRYTQKLFETELESFQKNLTRVAPFLYHELFEFPEWNQAKSMRGQWGKIANFDLTKWYNDIYPIKKHPVPIKLTKSDSEMEAAREQVAKMTRNMWKAFESLRETLLSLEYQQEIFGKGVKIEYGKEGSFNNVMGDFDNWMVTNKNKK
jgi:hypothetical protein